MDFPSWEELLQSLRYKDRACWRKCVWDIVDSGTLANKVVQRQRLELVQLYSKQPMQSYFLNGPVGISKHWVLSQQELVEDLELDFALELQIQKCH